MAKDAAARLAAIVATGAVAVTVTATPAGAATLTFSPEDSCGDFGVSVEQAEGTFSFRAVAAGGTRFISAGTGGASTYTNLSSPENQISLPSTGGAQQVTVNADGTFAVSSSGNFVIVLQEGTEDVSRVRDITVPSMTLVQGGRAVYDVVVLPDGRTQFILRSVVGQRSDFCEALVG